MTTTTVVRYRVHPGQADRNAGSSAPSTTSCARTARPASRTRRYRLEDGTFVHVAEEEHPGQLREVAAFRAFREGLDDRCAEPLVRMGAERVGAYRPG